MGRALFGYTVVNLGCKVNRVEADGFERLLAERGGVPVGEAAADLIVVNTCTVTGARPRRRPARAVRHALSTNDGARVVVTGCASELSSETFTAMDDRVVVVPKAGADLYLSELEMSGTAPCETSESFSASPADGRTRIGIKVQDGCDNACTYCIVHVARGRATSRPAGEVVAEAVALAESGVREVVLTGTTWALTTTAGTDLTRPMSPPSNGHRRSARRGRASLPLPHRLHRAYGRDRASSSLSSPRPRAASAAIFICPCSPARPGCCARWRAPTTPTSSAAGDSAGERPLHRADHRHHRGLPRRDR